MGNYSEFTVALLKEIFQNVNCYHPNNTDEDRFGKTPLKLRLKSIIKDILLNRIPYISSYRRQFTYNDIFNDNLEKLACLYHQLKDPFSREQLLKIISYRFLGPERVKLPLNTPEYWNERKKLAKLIKKKGTINPVGCIFNLAYFDLSSINYPINLYCSTIGVHLTFVHKQYEYCISDAVIKAENGDVVIDAGGCYGDTALYFADEVGATGKVYTFECIPSSIEIMKKNLALNETHQKRIEIVPYALWDSSGQTLYCKDAGPGSRVGFERQAVDDFAVQTLCIDDFADKYNVTKIDFIKMDIEGAELPALKGAVKVLRKYKPKLAIAIYHRFSDFTDIFEFISSLNLGYEFYLRHCTVYGEETMLYAISKP